MDYPIVMFWTFLAVIAAWGSMHVSMRDPPSTSWMKITFATALLVCFGAAKWLSQVPQVLGEGILAHAVGLLFFWPMVVIGAPLCVGSILGTLIGMYRIRNHHLS
jgi:hypothetical protein